MRSAVNVCILLCVCDQYLALTCEITAAPQEEPETRPRAIVNVSQVPQRSPFRYPGGKTWALPTIRRWFARMPTTPALLIEPFAGGGIVSLTAAFEHLARHVLMVERDDDVAAVWTTIIDGDAVWLAERIRTFCLTREAVVTTLAQAQDEMRERAFQTILRNRVQRGGIMARRAGLVKKGEDGRGVQSRWYAQTLYNRILDIVHVRKHITFVHGDGLDVMRANKRAGSRLYTHSVIDHEELLRITASYAPQRRVAR